ncbi:MAG: ACT domain-containing protein [Armatimonadota bacterium]|nr:ACT domain-containing protein [bacterium]
MKEYILTVMARDRVGIVCDVSTALAGLSGNITHLSQTVMRGYFTLIISVEMPDERTQSEIRQAVERTGEVGELEVSIKPYSEESAGPIAEAERFTLSMQGSDQKGIISKATCYLKERKVNIDDFYSYVHEGTLLMLAQVSVPVGIDVEELQTGLERVGKEFGLAVHFQHANIFQATGSISPRYS